MISFNKLNIKAVITTTQNCGHSWHQMTLNIILLQHLSPQINTSAPLIFVFLPFLIVLSYPKWYIKPFNCISQVKLFNPVHLFLAHLDKMTCSFTITSTKSLQIVIHCLIGWPISEWIIIRFSCNDITFVNRLTISPKIISQHLKFQT